LLAAGCGSAEGTHKGSSGGDTLALQFANCMRTHGVTDFPDPGQDSGRSVRGANSPAFIAASKTCDKLQPGGNPQPPKPSKSRQQAMVRFSECMRRYGIKNFPDPTLSPPPPNANVIDAAGIYVILPSGFDPHSPVDKDALHACGNGRGPL
jgi:hypothetical protein